MLKKNSMERLNSPSEQLEHLVELEEEIWYLQDVPDSIRFIEERMKKMSEFPAEIVVVHNRMSVMSIPELLDRVESLESRQEKGKGVDTGESSTGAIIGVLERVDEIEIAHTRLSETVSQVTEDFKTIFDSLRAEIAMINIKLNLTMRVMRSQTQATIAAEFNRVKIPEPKAFRGARDAKEIENFIFDMEQYLKATRTDEESKVTLATMHHTGDPKLWCRSKYHDISNRVCVISTWEELKRQLNDQFFLENVEFNPCRLLRELKQNGSIREYVRQFSGAMLNIRDMSEKDKIFTFIEDLKPWAITKLYEQRVQSLSSALATAERLFDYNTENPRPKKNTPSSSNAAKFQKPNTGPAKRKPFVPRESQEASNNANNQRPINRHISCFL